MPPRVMCTHVMHPEMHICFSNTLNMLAICVGSDVDAQDGCKWCCAERVHLRIANKSFSYINWILDMC